MNVTTEISKKVTSIWSSATLAIQQVHCWIYDGFIQHRLNFAAFLHDFKPNEEKWKDF